jgi:plasmid stability protein
MTVSVTIRDVPEDVRDALAARAARSGRSLQEYLKAELAELARRPSPTELWDRVQHRLLATGTRIDAQDVLDAVEADRR